MHKKILLNGFRTALLIVLGFIVYDINIKILSSIKNIYPELNSYYYLLSKVIKFSLIFILDICILYIYAYWFNIVI